MSSLIESIPFFSDENQETNKIQKMLFSMEKNINWTSLDISTGALHWRRQEKGRHHHLSANKTTSLCYLLLLVLFICVLPSRAFLIAVPFRPTIHRRTQDSIRPWISLAGAAPRTTFQRDILAMRSAAPDKLTAMTKETKQVAIIGAGAAGLAAARAFLRCPSFEVTVLEKSSFVGGIWKHDDKPARKERPVYRHLRTNLPRELMAFREYPWGSDGVGSSYVSHREVLRYLGDYANHFGLLDHVRLGCEVTRLQVLGEGSWPRLSLEWSSGGDRNQRTFDAVCVCNGHYALPSFPNLPGLSHFRGSTMHAIEYDDPAQFKNRTVACIGARASGADVAREISEYAARVYLSDSSCDAVKEYGKVSLVPRARFVDESGALHFSKSTKRSNGNNDDGSLVAMHIDTIIFCSGYDYDFPFINDQSNLQLSFVPGERRVKPLYEQLWHAQHPSLSFIGLPHSVVPFPLFELQAAAVVSQLTRKNDSVESLMHADDDDDGLHAPDSIPPLEERLEAANKDALAGGPNTPGRVQDTHYLGSHQWDYCRRMAKLGGIYDKDMENYIATNKAIYDRSGMERKSMIPGGKDIYRETKFQRNDHNQSYTIVSSEMTSMESTV